jgi:hypothetical protein
VAGGEVQREMKKKMVSIVLPTAPKGKKKNSATTQTEKKLRFSW